MSNKITTRYPEYIMQKLRQRRDLEPEDKSEDEDINAMSPNEALDEVCMWEGLIDYGSTIREWVSDIYNVELE